MKAKSRQQRNATRRRSEKTKRRKKREVRRETKRTKQAEKAGRLRIATHPLAYMVPYETALSVYGEKAEPRHLTERIANYDWRASLRRLAEIASIAANDQDGAVGTEASELMIDGLLRTRATTTAAARLIKRGRKYIQKKRQRFIVAHEEAINYVQHLVILYGGTELQPPPGDGEIALWLLSAGDIVDDWLERDTRPLTKDEEALADIIKTSRYNRSTNHLRAAARTYEIFKSSPAYGPMSGATWQTFQEAAFGGGFQEYFEHFVLPVFFLSQPPIARKGVSQEKILAGHMTQETKDLFTTRLRDFTATREQLQQRTRSRMRADGILPHAPTTLLHFPFIDMGKAGILRSSPWNVRAMLTTGIWAKYLLATKSILGDRRADEWMKAFGLMFEQWLGRVALMASECPPCTARVLVPAHPGATEEIEDVVVAEDAGVTLFSAKGRMVPEQVARQSRSRSSVIDWYENYFFAPANAAYRAGVVRQLSDKIDRLRSGEFEPRISRGLPVFPVLVTYDMLCESPLLYEWIAKRSKAHKVLQQENVGPLTVATVDQYELLMTHVAAGRSLVRILTERSTAWRERRLEIQLAGEAPCRPLEPLRSIYSEASSNMMSWLRSALGVTEL